MGRAILALLTIASFMKPASAADPQPARVDFTGEWVLDEASSSDKGTNANLSQEASKPQMGRGPVGGGLPGAGTSTDIPFEALADAVRINVADQGTKLVVAYVSSRQRVFFLDGEERELDDGGGPAKVVAKRKGPKIFVSSKWHGGSSLSESWECETTPRRLTVTGKGKGRHSFSYKRVYGPVSEAPAVDTPSPDTPSPETKSPPVVTPSNPTPSASSTAPPISIPFGRAECSIKPPRGATGAELAQLAKISSSDASARASASVKPERVTSVISSDVEIHEGCLVFPIDVRLADRKGVQEVFIDAGDGRVLGSGFEAN